MSKHASVQSLNSQNEQDEVSVRRHRSLGVGIPSTGSASREKTKDRRRDTLSVNVRHSRQISASSSSSSHGEPLHSRRIHTDYSHLPPSPGSSQIQQFLRHASTGSTSGQVSSPREQTTHAAANVAHSLLRGTQEGWSDLDDQATVEVLRKLDGISGRSARVRSSIGGHSRVGSSSRPSTPAKSGSQWEGVESHRISRSGQHGSLKDKSKEFASAQRTGVGLGLSGPEMPSDMEFGGGVKEEQHSSPAPEKPLKKHGSVSHRSSFTPKRSSASSTTYTSTPTTSSRDSASLSAATSATSVSNTSTKHPTNANKTRRNSAGSDISSNHSSDATSLRDRAAGLNTPADVVEEEVVPPVPPLPKDFSTLKAPPSSHGVAFPSSDSGEEKPRRNGSDVEVSSSLEVPTFSTPSKHQSLKSATPTSSTQKTPSKKWSFSNPLGKKLHSSPSNSSMKEPKSPGGMSLSPRTLSFSQLRKSTSRDHPMAVRAARKQSEEWTDINADAMESASSLVSLSSLGSAHPMSPPASAPPPITNSKTPDRLVPSRPETASSSSTNLTASVPPVPQQAPLSPSSSIRRGPSSKRLTPSSIPFFRRSSSQSMQMPPTGVASTSPTYSSTHSSHLRPPSSSSPTKEPQITSPTTPGSTHKKSSVLSLGLPSLLKGSSSRRSLHSDKEKGDTKSGKDSAKDSEKEKHKKDDKDRSESRISVLMGRKRGKVGLCLVTFTPLLTREQTLSSAQPKKLEPVTMPPMQMSALPPATTQRLANMKTGSNSSLSSTQSTPKSSRLTSQTVSSLQKQSDASLRGQRNMLPTIAGSPSVGTMAHQSSKEPPPSSSLNSSSALSKETPTKIPRISGRGSATNSPTLKGNGANRRASVIVGTGTSSVTASRGSSPTAHNDSSINEFGVIENGQTPKGNAGQRQSVRASPSTNATATATSRVPRQVSGSSSSTINGLTTRKNRESISFSGLRKSSTGSVASITTAAAASQNDPAPAAQSHRFSALSPSKGLKLLSPKIALSTARSSASASQSFTQVMASPGRHATTSTPSPVSSLIDEEEMVGDEEMMQYIKRQHAKKLASGSTQAELDEMLRFPEPIPPASPLSPAGT